MCGIAGFLSPNQRFTEADLKRMTNRIKHRGPDADGFFVEDHVGLGHRRLSIIDLSVAANQPMFSHNNRYVIIFNGEVYNFKDIAAELNIPFHTTGDTEVILEAYIKWGIDCVQKFNGMFALAIYDREEKSLLLFRDRFGVKPIYYYWNGSEFAFASELKALLELPIEKEIDLTAIKDYLFLEYIPAQRTAFKSIRRLENGCYLKVNKEGIKIKKYYNVVEKLGRKTKFKNESEAIEAFHSQLSSSVKYRQISDVPIGAFLSGGTDSSLVCSVFQEQNTQAINTFTIGFDVKEFDESGFANDVARRLKTNQRLTWSTEAESKETVNHVMDYYDEPFAVPSMIPSLLVCRKAREIVTVALSGDGGDELFMGYGQYVWYDRIEKVNNYGGPIARKVVNGILNKMNNTMQRASRIFDYEDEQRMWLHIWSQEQYMFTEKEIGDLFNVSYKHETILPSWETVDVLDIHPYEKISLFDINNYLANNLLYKMDIASMASSLEVRLPYLDYKLVEFALNLPVEMKIKNGQQKYLMKKLLEKFLPDDLIYRKKWGFPAPVGIWLAGELGFLIDKYLGAAVLKKQGLFNPEAVQRFVIEFRNGKSFHYKRIWALIVFQLWYEKYFDNRLWN